MGFNKLFQACSNFRTLAAADLNKTIQNYRSAIDSEIKGGLRAIQNLINTDPKAKNSNSLKSLQYNLNQMIQLNNQMTANAADVVVENLKKYIGNASFYTSKANTGTGFDPLTRAGGANSPGAYLDRITAHINKIEEILKKNKPAEQAPTTSQPNDNIIELPDNDVIELS